MAERIYIHAAAAVGPWGDTAAEERRPLRGSMPAPDLKAKLNALYGQSFRQASPLIEQALLGAGTCRQRLTGPVDPACAVYLGTGYGEMGKSIAVFEQLMPPCNAAASPFDFINSSSNLCAFYVAKTLGVRARNLTLSHEELSFEWALQRACSDLGYGAVPQALVGGLDTRLDDAGFCPPQFPLCEDRPVGEGGGWLFLGSAPERAIGEVMGVSLLPGGTEGWAGTVARHIRAWGMTGDSLILLPGLRLEREAVLQLQAALPGCSVSPYADYCGAFPTAAAFGLAASFDDAFPELDLLHVGRDRGGRTMIVGLRRY